MSDDMKDPPEEDHSGGEPEENSEPGKLSENAGEEQPAEEQPAEEQPAEEQPAEEQPAEEQPADNKMVDMIKQSAGGKETQNLDEENERILVLTEKVDEGEVFSIWDLDTYLHTKYQHVPAVIRFLIELILVGILIFAIPLLCIYITNDDPEVIDVYSRSTNTKTRWQRLFKANVFAFTWYVADVGFYIVTEGFIHAIGIILSILRLYNSEFCWRVAQSAYMQRSHLKSSFTYMFAFYLFTLMYVEYQRPGKGNYELKIVTATLLLWFSIYNAMLFAVQFALNISTFNMKQSVYRDDIIDINSKSFIFAKLKAIADKISSYGDYEYVIDNMDPVYDTGLGLMSLSFCNSEEEMKSVAKDILAVLDQEKLTYEYLEYFFPRNADKIYNYFTGADSNEDRSKVVEEPELAALAVELYRARRDMAKSLRDRDSIYDKLDIIFTIIVTYAAVILLLFLFQADYKMFMASFGTSLLTFSWIFADSIKSIYNCFIFLLIIRPYGIGDRVIIEDSVLVVYKVDLFTTTFLSLDKKVIYIPNAKLIGYHIANLARSPPQDDTLELAVDASTTYTQAISLQNKAKEMLLEQKHMFAGCELEKLAGGVMVFKISHTRNFQNFASLHARRTKSITIFRDAMKSLGITFTESYAFS